MPELTYLFQLILALFLGGVLGWQRVRWGKSAGPRTYALVTVGSTLFTILSLHGFAADQTAHVAAQIVTGIGFLGAGTILHKEDRIAGLTTAAGLWITAAIGMAVGIGYYFLASAATLLSLIVLMIDEHHLKILDHLPDKN